MKKAVESITIHGGTLPLTGFLRVMDTLGIPRDLIYHKADTSKGTH